MATIILHPTAKPTKVGEFACASCDALIPVYSLNGVLIEMDDSTELHRPGCSEISH